MHSLGQKDKKGVLRADQSNSEERLSQPYAVEANYIGLQQFYDLSDRLSKTQCIHSQLSYPTQTVVLGRSFGKKTSFECQNMKVGPRREDEKWHSRFEEEQ